MKGFCYALMILCLYSTCGFAHDANKAFFKIQQKGNVIEVQAEFPWSIRNAILETFSGAGIFKK